MVVRAEKYNPERPSYLPVSINTNNEYQSDSSDEGFATPVSNTSSPEFFDAPPIFIKEEKRAQYIQDVENPKEVQSDISSQNKDNLNIDKNTNGLCVENSNYIKDFVGTKVSEPEENTEQTQNLSNNLITTNREINKSTHLPHKPDSLNTETKPPTIENKHLLSPGDSLDADAALYIPKMRSKSCGASPRPVSAETERFLYLVDLASGKKVNNYSSLKDRVQSLMNCSSKKKYYASYGTRFSSLGVKNIVQRAEIRDERAAKSSSISYLKEKNKIVNENSSNKPSQKTYTKNQTIKAEVNEESDLITQIKQKRENMNKVSLHLSKRLCDKKYPTITNNESIFSTRKSNLINDSYNQTNIELVVTECNTIIEEEQSDINLYNEGDKTARITRSPSNSCVITGMKDFEYPNNERSNQFVYEDGHTNEKLHEKLINEDKNVNKTKMSDHTASDNSSLHEHIFEDITKETRILDNFPKTNNGILNANTDTNLIKYNNYNYKSVEQSENVSSNNHLLVPEIESQKKLEPLDERNSNLSIPINVPSDVINHMHSNNIKDLENNTGDSNFSDDTCDINIIDMTLKCETKNLSTSWSINTESSLIESKSLPVENTPIDNTQVHQSQTNDGLLTDICLETSKEKSYVPEDSNKHIEVMNISDDDEDEDISMQEDDTNEMYYYTSKNCKIITSGFTEYIKKNEGSNLNSTKSSLASLVSMLTEEHSSIKMSKLEDDMFDDTNEESVCSPNDKNAFNNDIALNELDKSLVESVRKNRIEKVRLLLKQGADPETPILGTGGNVLHKAVLLGHLYIVQALLAHGADYESRTTDLGNSPLHLACREGFDEIAVQLIESGCEVNGSNFYGVTPLQHALAYGRISTIILLLKYNGDPLQPNCVGETASTVASRLGYFKLHTSPKEIVLDNEQGTMVEVPPSNIPLEVKLIQGIEEECPLTVESCLNAGVDPNTIVPLALHWPAYATVLHRASHYGSDVTVILLLRSGADINVTDTVGNTPLHAAAQAGKNKIIKILLDNGANIEAVSQSGMTPLHRAASKGNEFTVNLLLRRGANLNKEDDEGRTAADWAWKRGFKKLSLKLGSRRKSSTTLRSAIPPQQDYLSHLHALYTAAIKNQF